MGFLKSYISSNFSFFPLMDDINRLLGCWSYKVGSYYEIKKVNEEFFWNEYETSGKILPATVGANWKGRLPADFPAEWYASLNNNGTMWFYIENDKLMSVY